MSLATAIFTSSLTAKPLADAIMNVKVTSVDKTLKVNVEKATEETVEVNIETTEGVVLHTDRIEKNAKWKRYDLRQLTVGKYNLVVLKNKAKLVQPFTLNFDAITIHETERAVTMLPQINFKNNRLEVRVFSSPTNSITVKIIDNVGITAYEETINASSYAKRYDVSKLPQGVYLVELSAGSDVEYATINL